MFLLKKVSIVIIFVVLCTTLVYSRINENTLNFINDDSNLDDIEGTNSFIINNNNNISNSKNIYTFIISFALIVTIIILFNKKNSRKNNRKKKNKWICKNNFIKYINFKISIVIIFMLIIFIFILLNRPIIPEEYQLIIETDSIPLLEPHNHESYDDKFTFDHGIKVNSDRWVAPEDLWITSFNGVINNAPWETLHHSLLFRMDKPNQICPNDRRLFEEISVMGRDHQGEIVHFPEPFGFFIPKGTPLQLFVMFHNPYPPDGPGGLYENVSMSMVMDVLGKNNNVYKNLKYYKLHLDNNPCKTLSQTFEVPPNVVDFIKKSEEFGKFNSARLRFQSSGRIIYLGGHVHANEGGQKLTAHINNDTLAEFIPYQLNSDIWSWKTTVLFNIFDINKGDVISLSSTYSNPTNETVYGAMGQIAFYFAPDD